MKSTELKGKYWIDVIIIYAIVIELKAEYGIDVRVIKRIKIKK